MESNNGLSVLVVEDNEGDFVLVSSFLNEAYDEIKILHEEKLESAIEVLTEGAFDAILLDLSLPDSNGIHSIMEVVNIASAPVIVLTGYGNKEFGIKTLAAGVEDYLAKDEINATILSKSINYSIERSRIRKELKKQQAIFQALIEKSTDMKTLITTEGKILYGTPSITTYLGYKPEDYLYKYQHDLVHPEDLEVLFSAMHDVINKPESSASFILRVKHKSGKYHWCEKTITNLLNDPDVSALVCNFWDVTERMAHVREIEEQNTLLKEIAWIQSHEVRAPMARIMGIIPLLSREEYNMNKQTSELVGHIMNSTKELDQIIKKIVDKTHELKKIV